MNYYSGFIGVYYNTIYSIAIMNQLELMLAIPSSRWFMRSTSCGRKRGIGHGLFIFQALEISQAVVTMD